jgi:hypothetical protein
VEVDVKYDEESCQPKGAGREEDIRARSSSVGIESLHSLRFESIRT